MPWICWELFFSMLRMCNTQKGSSLNLDLVLSCNYVMIMIMLMFIYIWMYVCMSCLTGSSWIMIIFMPMFICINVFMYFMSDRVIMDHDYFHANVYMHTCMYVCILCLTGSSWIMIINANIYMYIFVCMYVVVSQGR